MDALPASRCGLARDGVCTLVRSPRVSELHDAGQQPLLSSSSSCEVTTQVCQRHRRTRGMLVASSASISCAAAARLPLQSPLAQRRSVGLIAWNLMRFHVRGAPAAPIGMRRSDGFVPALCQRLCAWPGSRRGNRVTDATAARVVFFCAGEASSSATRHEGVPGSGCSAKIRVIPAADFLKAGF